MPENLSTDSGTAGEKPKARELSRSLAWPGRLGMLVLNLVPVLHVGLVAAWIFGTLEQGWFCWGAAVALIYLLPPLAARAVLALVPIRQTRIRVGSVAFFAWWSTFQAQLLFGRFPFLEEILRLVPGLYSFWLRLWGARIGRFTFWPPGTAITDRSFLRIGDDVVFGAGVRLNAHVLRQDGEGRIELVLAPIEIGNGTMVGGYSLLTAGTRLAAHEVTPAFLISPPFSDWRNGKRFRKEGRDGGAK